MILAFGGFGGPLAAADTETEGSVSDAHSLGDSDPGTTPTETTATALTPSVIDTVPTLLGSLDSNSLFGTDAEETTDGDTARGTEVEATGLTGPMALGVSTGSGTGTDAPAPVTDDNKGSDTVPAGATTPDVNEPETVVSHSPVTEPSPAPESPGADTPPPAAEPPAGEPAVVQPVASDVAVVEKSAAEVESAPIVGTAAAGDLIAVLAYLFITAPNDAAAQMIALPRGLLSLLGLPLTGDVATAPPTAGGIGGSLLAGGMAATRAALASSLSAGAGWPEMLIASAGSRPLSPARDVVHRVLQGASADGVKSEHLSLALADSVLVPEQVRSILRHTVGAVLAPLSLLVLALMASPGIAGLVLFGAAGTFVGYRQARAASILRAVGIGRFVKAGPLGVVRSGGLVALHSRTSRPSRTTQPEAVAALEPVA